jgi:hypothetical protein
MALHELEFLLCGFGWTGSECLAHKSSGFYTRTLRVSQVTFKYQSCIGDMHDVQEDEFIP